DGRLVFLVHRVGDGVEIRLVGRIVLVAEPVLDRAGGDGGQEGLFDGGPLERRSQVLDIVPDGVGAYIKDGPGAEHRPLAGPDEAALDAEVFRKLLRIATEDQLRGRSLARRELPRLEAADPLADVIGEVGLAQL